MWLDCVLAIKFLKLMEVSVHVLVIIWNNFRLFRIAQPTLSLRKLNVLGTVFKITFNLCYFNLADVIDVDHYHAVEVLKACGAVLILHVSREVTRLIGHPVYHEDGTISQISIDRKPVVAANVPEPIKQIPAPLQLISSPQQQSQAHIQSGLLTPNTNGIVENGKEITHKVTLHTTLIRDQIGQGLGFSIAGGKGSPPFKDGSDGIYISRVTPGGLAHRDGKIVVGDKVLVVR